MMEAPPEAGPAAVLLVLGGGPEVTGSDSDVLITTARMDPARFRFIVLANPLSDGYRNRLSRLLPGTTVFEAQQPAYGFLHPAIRPPRSPLWWAKFSMDSACRLRKIRRAHLGALGSARIRLVHTAASPFFAGAALARSLGVPHLWHCRETPARPGFFQRFWARRMLARSAAVLVPSRATGAIFGGRARIVEDGVDPRYLAPLPFASREAARLALGLPAQQRLVLCIGSLNPQKGQPDLVAAVGVLARRGLSDFSLVFLGTARTEADERVFVEAVRSAGLAADRVIRRSFTDDPRPYYLAADVVAHPAALPDSFPNVVREAQWLGLPIVATRTGGISEMIEDGVTGLLAEPKNPESLADALGRALSDSALAESLGRAAKESARRRYHPDAAAKAMMDIYENYLHA